jgi:hypothetical protein
VKTEEHADDTRPKAHLAEPLRRPLNHTPRSPCRCRRCMAWSQRSYDGSPAGELAAAARRTS